MTSVPASLASVHHTLLNLQSTVDGISFAISPPPKIEVSEAVWEDYRSRAWPLTPWLVGLREASGLPGLVVNYLGRRTVVDRIEDGRAQLEEAQRLVRKEIARLVNKTSDWSREDVRALGVFAWVWALVQVRSSLLTEQVVDKRLTPCQSCSRAWSQSELGPDMESQEDT
jgi:hypothetical protein